jgi:hypothetical protein
VEPEKYPHEAEPWLSAVTLPEVLVRGWTSEQRKLRAAAVGLDVDFPWADWVLAEGHADREARRFATGQAIQYSAEMKRRKARAEIKRDGPRADVARSALRTLRNVPRTSAANPWIRAERKPGGATRRRVVTRPREGRSTRRTRSTRGSPSDDPHPAEPPPDSDLNWVWREALDRFETRSEFRTLARLRDGMTKGGSL